MSNSTKKKRDPERLRKIVHQTILRYQTLLTTKNDGKEFYKTIKHLAIAFGNERFINENKNWSFLFETKFDSTLLEHITQIQSKCFHFNIEKNQFIGDYSNQCFVPLVQIVYELTKFQFKHESLEQFNKCLIRNNLLDKLFSFMRKIDCGFENELKLTVSTFNVKSFLLVLLSIINNLSENSETKSILFMSSHFLNQIVQFETKFKRFEQIDSVMRKKYIKLIEEIKTNFNQLPTEKVVKSLCAKKIDEFAILNDEELAKNLNYIFKLTKREIFNEWNLLSKENFVTLLVNLTDYFYNIRNEPVLMEKLENINVSVNRNQKKPILFNGLLKLLNIIHLKCFKLSSDLCNNLKFFQTILNFFNDSKLIEKLLVANSHILILLIRCFLFTLKNSSANESFFHVLLTNYDALAANMDLLVKNNDDDVVEWCTHVRVELEYIKNRGNITNFKYLLKKQLDNLTKIENFLYSNKYFAKQIIQVSKNSASYEFFKMKPSILFTLCSLVHLSEYPKTRSLIYFYYNSVKAILFKANMIEKIYSIRLLNNLCLSQSILVEISNDEKLFDFLSDMNKSSSTDNSFKLACQELFKKRDHCLKGQQFQIELPQESSRPLAKHSTQSHEASSANSDKDSVITSSSSTKSFVSPIEEWTNDCVKTWFEKQKINIKIAETYENMDGKELKQLYVLSQEIPEFFYQSIINENSNQLQVIDVAQFSSELQKLFTNKCC
jgi:hypothetical protein